MVAFAMSISTNNFWFLFSPLTPQLHRIQRIQPRTCARYGNGGDDEPPFDSARCALNAKLSTIPKVTATSLKMFALIVRFQQLTSYLSPVAGYFGQIDGGQDPTIETFITRSILIQTFEFPLK
jgi:hypothetical protein